MNQKIKSFLDLVGGRSSCRKYLDTPVPDELLDNCIEAARLAPSACNRQPWRFIVVKDASLRGQICEKGLLPGISMPWLKSVPVIVVVCVEKSLVTHKIAPFISGIPYHLIDAGIAGEHFVLAATACGLGTCWIGWLKEKQIGKTLGIPSSIKVLSLISVGFPAEPQELRGKKRLAREDIVRLDGWKNT